MIRSEDDLSAQVAAIYLSHEFAANTAGRKYMDFTSGLISPHGDNLLKPILASGNHRSKSTSFCA
nr:hypothetical protein [Devosia soli]